MDFKISLARLKEAIGCNEGFCLECGDFTVDFAEPDAEGYHCPVCEQPKVVGAENLMFTAGVNITEEEEPPGGILAGMALGTAITTAVMEGTLESEVGRRLHEIHETVCRDIFCGQCEGIMNTWKSVLVTAHIRSTRGALQVLVLESFGSFVICGGCWDTKEAGLKSAYEGATFTVTDFRDYGPDFQLKKQPLVPAKPPRVANVRVEGGDLEVVEYSKRFQAHGFTFFIHGVKGFWCVSSWACGHKLGTYPTQKAGIERAERLSKSEVDILKGSISLNSSANPPVKGAR